MANTYVKYLHTVHKQLRKDIRDKGDECAEEVWADHLQNIEVLEKYALSMVTLATEVWEKKQENKSRISWIHEQSMDYFHKGGLGLRTSKEQRKSKFHSSNSEDVNLSWEVPETLTKIKLLDVGSCYNPFAKYEEFDVTAIDLQPGTPNVYKCDFLALKITQDPSNEEESPPSKKQKTDALTNITYLPEATFDVLTFCFLLEYIPSPRLRFECCKKAYNLLKPNGLLCIVSPDSKHLGSNVQLFKLWKITLMLLGFERIRYEKLTHFHGMIFRKGLIPSLWQADAIEEFEKNKIKYNQLKLEDICIDKVKNSIYIHQDLRNEDVDEEF